MSPKIGRLLRSALNAEISGHSRSGAHLSRKQSGNRSMTAPGEGGWYSRLDPEPIDVFEAWALPWHETTILQYVIRWRGKNGIEDLKKARWYLDRLIALAERERAHGTRQS